MITRAPHRLPGIRFEFQAPPPTDVLPRMDVAVFIGFAESGPLHMPVVVEDVAQFTATFGNNVPLAWDQQRGEQVYASLAPVVRSFFHNGGQRCWIVRVASEEAQYNYFPIPGLALVTQDHALMPAFAKARSEGSWSDELQVGTSLLSRSIFVQQVQLAQEEVLIDLSAASPDEIVAGDLLRLTFSQERYVLMLAVQTVRFASRSSSGSSSGEQEPGQVYGSTGRGTLHITARASLWLSNHSPSSPPPTPEQVVLFIHGAERAPVPVSGSWQEDQSMTLHLKMAYADAPVPGSLVRVDCTDTTDQLWLTVESARLRHNTGSSAEDTVEVIGQAVWVLHHPPAPSSLPDVEKLSFTLLTQRSNGYPVSLADLAFSADHPRFWKALPTDEQLYQGAEVTSDPEHTVGWKTAPHALYTDVWLTAANPRFPLAGDDTPGEIFFPLVLPPQLGGSLSPLHFTLCDKGAGQRLDALVRDGLREFKASLFLDQNMVDALTSDLMMQADFLRYQRTEPGARAVLRGIYAALTIEEASIIALPDAYQLGWKPTRPANPLPPVPQQRSHPHVSAEHRSTFHSAEMDVIEQPLLKLEGEPDHVGTFTLAWSSPENARAILEEAPHSDYRDAVEVYRGSEQSLTLYGRGQGHYYYRVRIENADAASDWSNGLVVSITPTQRWCLNTEAEYDVRTLLTIQRALIRMCAARGDLFAVLALPEHFHEEKALAYIATLKAWPAQTEQFQEAYHVSPLGYDERVAFSYAALYYPWLVLRDDQSVSGKTLAAPALKRVPPDGTVCGVMAKRALMRGAWMAPANELFSGVMALTTGIGLHKQRLQIAQVNVLRQERRGFLVLNADTLCDEEDANMQSINVRRLLILLRRMALRLGATFVFELESDTFRRLVHREFEAMLEQMFKRGAFAGTTPDTSFQVRVEPGQNLAPMTLQSNDTGRFLVELRVAPSLPLTFLTLRLVQSGTTVSVAEVL